MMNKEQSADNKKQYDVFISYSSKDNVKPDCKVSKIKEALSKAGVKCWFDKEKLGLCDAYTTEIAKAIENSKIVIYFSSKEANNAFWVEQEIKLAGENKKVIIPVLLDASPFPDSFKLLLAGHQYVEYPKDAESMQKFVDSISDKIVNIKEPEQQLIDDIEHSFETIEKKEAAIEKEREELMNKANEISDEKKRIEKQDLIKMSSPKQMSGEIIALKKELDKLNNRKPVITQNKKMHWIYNSIIVLLLIALTSYHFYIRDTANSVDFESDKSYLFDMIQLSVNKEKIDTLINSFYARYGCDFSFNNKKGFYYRYFKNTKNYEWYKPIEGKSTVDAGNEIEQDSVTKSLQYEIFKMLTNMRDFSDGSVVVLPGAFGDKKKEPQKDTLKLHSGKGEFSKGFFNYEPKDVLDKKGILEVDAYDENTNDTLGKFMGKLSFKGRDIIYQGNFKDKKGEEKVFLFRGRN